MNIFEKTIGNGALFPIQLNNGSWEISRGDIELINNNITSILVYQFGTRIRQEIFGNRNWECIEEPNVELTRLLVYKFTINAIQAWEPRVKLSSVDVTINKTSIDVKLRYIVNTTKLVGELDFSYQNPW